MRRLAVLIGTIVGVAVGIVIATTWLVDTTAQNTHTVTVEVSKSVESESEDGVECFPWGLVDSSLEVRPFRQLIVTDDHGVVVGVMDLQVGTLQTAENERRSCVVSDPIELSESPFYTFTVDGKYRRTISADTLTEMDWYLPMHLV